MIIAIEPDKENCKLLYENTKPFRKNMKIEREAIWHKKTILNISTGFRDGREYAFSVLPNLEGSFEEVESVTICELKKQYSISKIDILKIDVEGTEKFLFERDEEIQNTMNNVIILALEIHDEVANRELIDYNLKKLGYKITQIK